MQKTKMTLVGIVVAAVGWFFFKNFEVTKDFQVRGKTTATTATASGELPPAAEGETIRIATFNIQVLGEKKIGKPQVLDALAKICGEFDVVAIQELRDKDTGEATIKKLVAAIKAVSGRSMSYVIGPRLGDTVSKEQYVYLYDTASILCDVDQVYTVQDPDRLLHRPPLVALFRARKPSPEQAFTFMLADIHTDPDQAVAETSAMQLVLDALRADGRNEDDVMLLGDFNTSNKKLGRLGEVKGLVDVLSDQPTTPDGKKQYDHIFFLDFATKEFRQAGVFDTVRQFNLSLEQAEEISDHCPVWAEFSVYEGGAPSALATRNPTSTSR